MLFFLLMACTPIASAPSSSDKDSGGGVEPIPTTATEPAAPPPSPASEPAEEPIDSGEGELANDTAAEDTASTVCTDPLDQDCDGIPTLEDCNDTDPNLLAFAVDADCDGVLTADDCNDGDAALLELNNDADCDGIITANDCNDGDATSTAMTDDADCDGVLTADDCNDGDPALLELAADADCDGVLSGEDCDDNNASIVDICASGFNECVSDYCVQQGTQDQATKCGSSSADGLTCYDPEIRYGTTQGGHPCVHTGNNYTTWCQQLGFSGYTTHTFSNINVTGKLFGCTSYDESTWHWCDWQDGSWLNSTLNSTGQCDYINAISCF